MLRSRAPCRSSACSTCGGSCARASPTRTARACFHLDLKPADVRLTPAGEVKARRLRLVAPEGPRAAAGRARPTRASTTARPRSSAGRRPDRRADVFSVGAIVYELVAYRKAFPGDSTTDVVRGLTRCEPDLACLPRTPSPRGSSACWRRASPARPTRATPPSRTSTPTSSSSCARPCRACAATSGEPTGEPSRARGAARERDAGAGRGSARGRAGGLPQAPRARLRGRGGPARHVRDRVGPARARGGRARREWRSPTRRTASSTLATGIAEKVERLAPWSPRYLQLQVYLDEEGARRRADGLVATRPRAPRRRPRLGGAAAARDALAAMPGHKPAPASSRSSSEAARGRPRLRLRSSGADPLRRRRNRQPQLCRHRCHRRTRHASSRARPRQRAATGPRDALGPDPRIAEAVALERRRAPALPEGRSRPGPEGRRAGPGPRSSEPPRPGAPEDPARARLSFAL